MMLNVYFNPIHNILIRPKFQKRSALKFDSRIIPEAKPSGINVGLIPHPRGLSFFGYSIAGGGVVHLYFLKRLMLISN